MAIGNGRLGMGDWECRLAKLTRPTVRLIPAAGSNQVDQQFVN